MGEAESFPGEKIPWPSIRAPCMFTLFSKACFRFLVLNIDAITFCIGEPRQLRLLHTRIRITESGRLIRQSFLPCPLSLSLPCVTDHAVAFRMTQEDHDAIEAERDVDLNEQSRLAESPEPA